MGVVYRAHDEALDRDVALKLLTPETLGDDVAKAMFRKEALSLSRMNHPNIRTVFEIGEADGEAFLAMEFVEGRPLRALTSHAMASEAVLRYGIQMALGLGQRAWRGSFPRPATTPDASRS